MLTFSLLGLICITEQRNFSIRQSHCHIKEGKAYSIPSLPSRGGKKGRYCTGDGTPAPSFLHEEIFVKKPHTQSQGASSNSRSFFKFRKTYHSLFMHWPFLGTILKGTQNQDIILNYQNIFPSNSTGKYIKHFWQLDNQGFSLTEKISI